MALEGSIRDFALPDIIQFIQQQSKSGVLTIEEKTRWAKILFEEGKIVFAYTPESETPKGIAQELIDGEWIPEVKIRSMMIGNPDWEAFENSLVGPGGLSNEILGQFYILHTTEILYRLFQLQDGKYSFEAAGGIRKPRYATPMDSDYILLEGMRQFDEWPMLRRQVPSDNILFDKDPEKISTVRVVPDEPESGTTDPGGPPQGGGITAVEMEVYEKVDGHRDVAKLAALTKKGEFETVKVLASLFAMGLIVKIGERQPAEAPGGEAVIKLQEPVRATVRKPLRAGTYPYVWTGVVVLILSAWTFIYAPGLKTSLMGTKNFRELIKADLITVEKRTAREMVLVYFLRNGRFPQSAEELTRSFKAAGPVFESLKDKGISFEEGISGIP